MMWFHSQPLDHSHQYPQLCFNSTKKQIVILRKMQIVFQISR